MADVTNRCCTLAVQQTCCEPSEKASCCDESHGELDPTGPDIEAGSNAGRGRWLVW